ncbi:MAG: glycosyltransferase [Candidatus Sungbacteria bacterium]|nr:glycosyltransferase [Candidatus Sungbacteria bacterium]
MDKNDPVLGFFHRWVEEFNKCFEKITVICLEQGEYNLPNKILSLGKEKKVSKFTYLINFYKYIWQERNNYDAIFVHMNQEYVLLGWKFWKLWGKKIYLWRNHAKGDLLTALAVWLSHKVFYTSPSSFTAGFKKAIQMPVGIDTDFFKPDLDIARVPNSILFLGRISPVKKVLEFVEWFNTLDNKFVATVAGSALSKDKNYEELVQSRASDRIKFIGAVDQEQALKLYQSHEIYVNKTPAGSYDKTIFEAAACGMKLKVDNPDAQNIKVENHSLDKLMEKLKKELS